MQASWRHVARVSYATSLMRQGVLISTTEHLLSAFYSMGLDNAYVEIDNLEVPILDGSGLPLVKKTPKVAAAPSMPVVEGYSSEVTALLPLVARLNPMGLHSLKRILQNPEQANELLHSLAQLDPELVGPAIAESFRKLDPRRQVRNPVMFVVYVGSILTTALWIQALVAKGEASQGFILGITLWLWFTVLFANFAEAMAEGRGKAQAATLRKSRAETTAQHQMPVAAPIDDRDPGSQRSGRASPKLISHPAIGDRDVALLERINFVLSNWGNIWEKLDPYQSKKAHIIAMLRVPGGVTIEAMARAANWQPHSVRGFLAGVVRKKLGLNLISAAGDSGRVYRIADRSASSCVATAKTSHAV